MVHIKVKISIRNLAFFKNKFVKQVRLHLYLAFELRQINPLNLL